MDLHDILIDHTHSIKKSQLLQPFMPCFCGGLSESDSMFLPPPLPEAVPIKIHNVRVHIGGLVEGCSGGLLSRGDAHSVWVCDLANIVVSRGHSRWCPGYVESGQALPYTTKVTRQQCSVSFRWQPTNDLKSPPVDLWGKNKPWMWPAVGDAWTSRAGEMFMTMRSAQMMGQQQKTKQKNNKPQQL